MSVVSNNPVTIPKFMLVAVAPILSAGTVSAMKIAQTTMFIPPAKPSKSRPMMCVYTLRNIIGTQDRITREFASSAARHLPISIILLVTRAPIIRPRMPAAVMITVKMCSQGFFSSRRMPDALYPASAKPTERFEIPEVM